MEGVEIREAMATDKSAVLALNENVYNGTDYMKALFDSFISCPYARPYVLLYNKEIDAFFTSVNDRSETHFINGLMTMLVVSFVIAFLVDDGNTVISRGGRTKDKWAGKGFFKTLKKHIQDSSSARVLAFTSSDYNKALASSSFQRQYKRITHRSSRTFDFDVKSLPEKPEVPVSISKLTKAKLEHYMTSEQHIQYLFPENRLIVNWIPFKLLTSNITIIWDWVLLGNEASLALSDVRNQNDVIAGLVSIVLTYSGSGGMLVVKVDIYGTDETSLRVHLRAHMGFILGRTDGPVAMIICCDPRISSLVEKMFGEYNMADSDLERGVDILHVFEKQL